MEVVRNMRRDGVVAGLLNSFRWDGHPLNHMFDVHGHWRGDAHAEVHRRGEAAGVEPRPSAAEVQARVDELPQETFATDDELRSRCVHSVRSCTACGRA